MRTIAIINQKGGCGKTTTAINLAAVLAASGYRTLLVDLDPQSHCAAGLAVPESRIERDVADLLLADASKTPEPDRVVWRVARDFDLLPSRTRLAGLEAARGGLADADRRERRLSEALGRIQERARPAYSVCIIDCPPSIGLLTYNALVAAKEILIPVETSFFSLEGATKQVATLRSLARRFGVRNRARLLPTIHHPADPLAVDLLTELERRFGERVIPHAIRYDGTLREAASFGRSVIDYDPVSTGAQDYRALARWLIDQGRIELTGSEDDLLPAETITGSGLPLGARRTPGRETPMPREQWLRQRASGGTAAGAGRGAGVGLGNGAGSGAGAGPGAGAGAETSPRLVEARRLAEELRSATAAGLSQTSRPDIGSGGERGRAMPATAARSEGPAPEIEALARLDDLRHRAAALGASVGREIAGREESEIGLVMTRRGGGLALMERTPSRPSGAVLSLQRLLGVRVSNGTLLFVQPLGLGQSVHVVGDFNDWTPGVHVMRRNEELGVFELSVPSPGGKQRYRLLVDGELMTDPHNEDRERNELGELNSVIAGELMT